MLPTHENCLHSTDGWCLKCVQALAQKLEQLEAYTSCAWSPAMEPEAMEARQRESDRRYLASHQTE